MAAAIAPLALSTWTWWSQATAMFRAAVVGTARPAPSALVLMELLIFVVLPPVAGSLKSGAVITRIETAGEPRRDTWASDGRRTAAGTHVVPVTGAKAREDGRPLIGVRYTV